MFKRFFCISFLLVLVLTSAKANNKHDILISTKKTSMLIEATPGNPLRFLYYGSILTADQVVEIRSSQNNLQRSAYPVFGTDLIMEPAVQIVHADGNMTLDFYTKGYKSSNVDGGVLTEVTLADRYYPLEMKVFYRTRIAEDIIEQWTEIIHKEKKAVELRRFDSAYMPVRRGDVWISHLHGTWSSENTLTEEPLTHGMKVIKNLDGSRNGRLAQAEVMISLDGKPSEQSGRVIGAALCWSGNFKLRFDTDNNMVHHFFAGMNDESSAYRLEPREVFQTPRVAWTYSTEGVGGVSRNYHRWARNGNLHGGDKTRDVLLNSWEGLTFNITEKGMHEMMSDISSLGGELFVMDDGWFGAKYPRNSSKTSLGDWVVDTRKLPNGIKGLLDEAKRLGIRFGIWVEPEAVNTQSELYEKHPDWALKVPNRDFHFGRGGTQLLLDLTNPKVQEHAFRVVDDLLTANPEIAYIKWDANIEMRNYGSNYLPKYKQSHLYIEYHRGLEKVLKRVRAKYPNVVMQACGGGGGRVNYGVMPYFDEFWVSDNTDALQRIFMQWGASYFYPSMAMAQHVGMQPNFQTGRTLPLKFRFDVAMTGRMGLELIPSEMTEAERVFSAQAIKEYKQIREVVQLGELYRLVSPYSKQGVASLMYVSPEKHKAVFFAYKLEHFYNQTLPRLRMAGLDHTKKYRIKELTLPEGEIPSYLHNEVFSGALLMNEGIELPLKKEYASRVLELVAE